MTGVQAALEFIGAARRDDSMRRGLEQLGDAATYGHLVELGRERGLVFTEDELRRAHALDWRMRQAHYGVR